VRVYIKIILSYFQKKKNNESLKWICLS